MPTGGRLINSVPSPAQTHQKSDADAHSHAFLNSCETHGKTDRWRVTMSCYDCMEQVINTSLGRQNNNKDNKK